MGENAWAPCILTPTAVQLAIYTVPLPFLPRDEEALLPYLRQAIHNNKGTPIVAARYLNASRDSRETK